MYIHDMEISVFKHNFSELAREMIWEKTSCGFISEKDHFGCEFSGHPTGLVRSPHSSYFSFHLLMITGVFRTIVWATPNKRLPPKRLDLSFRRGGKRILCL